MNMNAFSRLVKILLFFGTWGSFLNTNAEEENRRLAHVPQHLSSQAATRRLRGTAQLHDPNNEIRSVTTSSSSSRESQSATTPSARELAIGDYERQCTVWSLSDLRSKLENTTACPYIFANDTISISQEDGDVVLDGRNKTLIPTYQIAFERPQFEVIDPGARIEIRNFNMDGDYRATYAVKARSQTVVSIVSCNITDFAAYGLYGKDNAAVWVTNSSIFGNRWFGVGLFDHAGLFLRGSTIYDNGVYGIVSRKSKVYVEQSTISKHSDFAIFADSTDDSFVDVIVSHSTLVAENDTTVPLVLALDGASISLDNSILVNPSHAAWGLSGGEVIDGGFNAIQASEYPDPQSISNTTIVSDNLLLGDLEDNGGPTLTHALLEGSLAIDAGNCSSSLSDHWFFVDQVVFDQRGVARPQGSGCDVGAYEFEVEVAV